MKRQNHSPSRSGLWLLVSGVAYDAQAAQSPLVVRVTTDRHVYRLRRPVRITLTETNTSDHEIPVAIGCQILHGFITHDAETVWTFHDYTLCATGEEMPQAGTSRTLGPLLERPTQRRRAA